MKKKACFLGIAVAALLIIFGIIALCTAGHQFSYSGSTASNTSFGADFYTYSYRATRYAANNVSKLGELTEEALETIAKQQGQLKAAVLLASGALCLVISLLSLASVEDNQKKLNLLSRLVEKAECIPCGCEEETAAQAAPLQEIAMEEQ